MDLPNDTGDGERERTGLPAGHGRLSPSGAPEDGAAILAHEMRGPLAVVNGYLGLLGRADDEETKAYALSAAQHAVERMDALIDDVLESVSSHHTDQRPLEPTDAAEVVRSLLVDRPHYAERVLFMASCDSLVRADELHLTRAVANVLDNALKFSPPGAPIRVELVRSGGAVALFVDDEGPGIPAEDADRLMRPFERLGRDESLPGYGIGLGIAVELVESMGGQLALSDRPDGHGARVEIRLPISVPSDAGAL